MQKEKSKEKKSTKRPKNQATNLVTMVEKLGVKLFHDQTQTPFALISEDGYSTAWPTSNRNFKRWLARQYYKRAKTVPGSDALRQAITVLEGRACFEGEQIPLVSRVAWNGGALYYDLADQKGRAVKITAKGWAVVEHPKIIFRRYEHQEAQVEPVIDGDINALIPFLNLEDENQIPLEMVYIVTCFIPGIPHPIHVSYGPQGSAKSTQDRTKRRLIDPSANDIQTLTSKTEQTVLVLSQNWFCAFDNVSYMNEETSDLLCRASTGASYSKRALYTDDEAVIQKLGCCVSLNGINVVVNKPDLMDRSVLIEYARISEGCRKEEKEILGEFEAEKAGILGGIFDVLAKAIRIKPTIEVQGIPRMADFALWGMAVSEAMGYGADTFLELYDRNIKKQNEEIIKGHD